MSHVTRGRRGEVTAEASASFAPETGSMQTFSFPAQRVLCIQAEGMEVYCKLGLGGLRLSSNIMTKTCPKEGPCGNSTGRRECGGPVRLPVLPPCAVGPPRASGHGLSGLWVGLSPGLAGCELG